MFKHMKIGKKLIVSFIAVSLIASIAGVVSAFIISNIDSGYSRALPNYGFAQGDIGKAMLMLADNRRASRDIVNLTKQENIDAAKKDLADTETKYAEYEKKVEASLVLESNKTLFAEMKTDLDKYREARDRVVALGDTTDPERSLQARQSMIDDVDPLYESVYNKYVQIMDAKVTGGNTESTALTNQSQVSLMINIGLIVVALIISVILGIYVSKNISKPVKACADRLVLLSKGDLHTEVAVSGSRDETGVMLDALKTTTTRLSDFVGDISGHLGSISNGDLTNSVTMDYEGDFNPLKVSLVKILDSLNDAMSQINQSAEQVASGSDQVSSGAQALSQGATEQASSIEELSASIAEISGQIKQNAESASNASTEASSVEGEIENGDRQMKELVLAMKEINGASDEIGKIIKTIDDIAFQTNILALNAAVEAARAGAAGKGFAVVADEVRNLAGKSAEAAKNTTVLIENSIRAVENGTKMANSTADALEQITKGAVHITGLINAISEASGEQATSAAQVTQGVEQISAVVQTNSATAEESAAASEELSGQAQILKDLVGRFKVRDGASYDTGAGQDYVNANASLEPKELQYSISKY